MKLKAILLVFLLLGSMFVFPVSAFDKEVYDFDRIWYSQTNGFNKNSDGTLILAVTYTNNSFRTIDYCSIEFYQNPFYFSIEFQDELEIQYDSEGDIIYQEQSDGYVFLRKSVVDTYIPKIKELATRGVKYKTITFQSVQWYRIYVPNFNNEYEWKQYQNPIINEEWFTWGNNASISFEKKAMYIKQLSQSFGHLEFDFTHPTDNSGQTVRISKSYLLSEGITTPYFEWGEKIPWKVISYTQNATHYFINPEHFSIVGIHEATSGEQRALIVNTTDDIADKTVISTAGANAGSAWGDHYEIFTDNWGEIDYAWIGYHSTPSTTSITINATVGIADSSGTWIVNINENKSVSSYGTSKYGADYDFIDIFLDNLSTYRLRVIIHWSSRTNLKWNQLVSNNYAYGHGDYHATNDYAFKLYGKTGGSYVNTTRNVGSSAERDIVNGTLLQSFASVACVKIKVPVSDSTQGITEVLNQTTMTVATNVSALAGLTNNTYYFDSANQFVYIGTESLSSGQLINWSVNCTFGAEFDVEPPTFVVLGLPFEFIGLIKDSGGDGIDGFIATTRIMYTNGADAITPVPHNCSGGNIFCTISTCSLTPGQYKWEISFYDTGSSVVFKKGGDLSVSTGVHGHYDAMAIFHVYDDSTGLASHSPQFTFYDPSMGTGINTVILKLYVSEDTTFTESDRVYQQDFSTYTGQTLYYKVLDYFNNTIYPDYADYDSVVINSVNQFIDIPIQMWMFSVKNMNHSIVLFELHNGTRAYQAYLFPYEPFYWYVFNGTYDINITYINPETDVIVDYLNTTIDIDNHTYYWIRGYDLRDIIIEVQITNSTVNSLNLSITADISFMNSTVDTITTDIISNLTLTESNLTTLINSYSANYTIIESLISYLNNTIWTNFTSVDATINTINNKLTIDFDILNTTIDYLNNTVWMNFDAVHSNMSNVTINVKSSLALTESNLTTLNNYIWNSINVTDTMITYFNDTIWSNLTLIKTVVDNIDNNIWINLSIIESAVGNISTNVSINYDIINTSIDSLNNSLSIRISLVESNLTSLSNNIWNSINITDSIITYFNNTIWNEISALNTTIDYLNNTIWTNFTILNSTINALNITISSNFSLMETNITSVIFSVWTALNITNATIDDFNATIWNNLTLLQNAINNTNISISNIIMLTENNITSLIITIDNIIDYALMPDAIIWSRNPPIVFSCFNRIGMMLGGNVWHVCPPVNVIAQTRNETFGNWINSTPLVPSNGTTENGSITIVEDIIYFSAVGGTTPIWVNITYTGNGTLIQNTTYMPVKFYPEGYNVTVNASSNIYITRETRFNQLKKFYWDIYNGTDNPGWITELNGQKRAGYHRAGFEIENTMDTIWYEVYVYGGYSPTSAVDLTTVRLTDIDNDNTLCEEGENFRIEGGGISFRVLGSINVSETRNYQAEYYKSRSDQYHYGFEIIHIDSYEEFIRMDEKLYNYFRYTWVNPYPKTYRGTLSYYFDFPVETDIEQDTTIVYDAGLQQNITDFLINNQFLTISSGAVGDVSPGSGKTFEVYFRLKEYPGRSTEDIHLTTPLREVEGLGISLLIILVAIGLIMMISGILLLVFRQKKDFEKIEKIMILFGLLIVVTTWILSALGV